jgi:hypothetical protein
MEDVFRRHLVAETKHRPQIGQEANAQAGLGLLGFRHKRNCCLTRALWPFPTDSVSNGDQ